MVRYLRGRSSRHIGARDGARRRARRHHHPMLAMLCALLLPAALASVADEDTTKLPKNMTLIVPVGAEQWRLGVKQTNEALGGKVSCLAILCTPDDVEAFGPITNMLAEKFGSDRAIYLAPIFDATYDTIGDESLSLPHIILISPPTGVAKMWDKWQPNMFDAEARVSAASAIVAWANEHLDDCAEAGDCDEAIDEMKAAVVRRRVAADIRTQSNQGGANVASKRNAGDEEIIDASKLRMRKKKKGKRRKRKAGETKDEV